MVVYYALRSFAHRRLLYGDPLSAWFDHNTSEKSRRAIIITCSMIIVGHHIQFASNELEIFKLKILINKEQLIFFLKAGLLYLLYNFFTVEFSDQYNRRLEQLRIALEKEIFEEKRIRRHLKVSNLPGDTPPGDFQSEAELKATIAAFIDENTKKHLLYVGIFLRVLRDYLPIFCFAFVALSEVHINILKNYFG